MGVQTNEMLALCAVAHVVYTRFFFAFMCASYVCRGQLSYVILNQSFVMYGREAPRARPLRCTFPQRPRA